MTTIAKGAPEGQGRKGGAGRLGRTMLARRGTWALALAAAGAAGWLWFGHAPAGPGGGKASAPEGGKAAAADGAKAAGGQRGGAGGPPLVRLVAAQKQDVAVDVDANGTVVPLSSVEIRAQVSREVRQVHVKEGQNVAAGALLFTLDSRAESAALEQARAHLVRSEASLAEAERQAGRSRELMAQRFISTSAADSAQTQLETARAQVQSDRAALRAAQVDLDRTVLRAPSAGRIGAINVYPGSMAQAAAPLVTVTQMDPIAVSFAVPESGLPGLLDGLGAAAVTATVPASGPGADAHSFTGRLSFIDSAVDAQAGTIRVKAQFSNHGAQLWPGQFVQARVTLATLRSAVVVPLAAIVTTGNTARVYTVEKGADGAAQAQPRSVKVLHAFGGGAAVAGLSDGEEVIVEGKQNLKPGLKVRIGQGAPAKGATLAAQGAAS